MMMVFWRTHLQLFFLSCSRLFFFFHSTNTPSSSVAELEKKLLGRLGAQLHVCAACVGGGHKGH